MPPQKVLSSGAPPAGTSATIEGQEPSATGAPPAISSETSAGAAASRAGCATAAGASARSAAAAMRRRREVERRSMTAPSALPGCPARRTVRVLYAIASPASRSSAAITDRWRMFASVPVGAGRAGPRRVYG